MVSLFGAINYESTALRVDGCRQKPNLTLVEETENFVWILGDFVKMISRPVASQIKFNLSRFCWARGPCDDSPPCETINRCNNEVHSLTSVITEPHKHLNPSSDRAKVEN